MLPPISTESSMFPFDSPFPLCDSTSYLYTFGATWCTEKAGQKGTCNIHSVAAFADVPCPGYRRFPLVLKMYAIKNLRIGRSDQPVRCTDGRLVLFGPVSVVSSSMTMQ